MTSPTPTLPESAADVVPDNAAADIKSRLMRALQTMSNDDCSMPGSKLRERHSERSAAILGAVEFIDALASRSTQPEGETGSPGWLYHNPDTGVEFSEDHPIESGQVDDAEDVRPANAENLKEALIASWHEVEELTRYRDAYPQPEAAASGDVGEIERLMDKALGWREAATRDGDDNEIWDRARQERDTLLTAICSLAAQARGQALEEAANRVERMFTHRPEAGREIAAAIRALIPQPSAPAVHTEAPASPEGLLQEVPAEVADFYENKARNLSNLWANGTPAARVCITADLLKAWISGHTRGREIFRAFAEPGSTQGGEAR